MLSRLLSEMMDLLLAVLLFVLGSASVHVFLPVPEHSVHQSPQPRRQAHQQGRRCLPSRYRTQAEKGKTAKRNAAAAAAGTEDEDENGECEVMKRAAKRAKNKEFDGTTSRWTWNLEEIRQTYLPLLGRQTQGHSLRQTSTL